MKETHTHRLPFFAVLPERAQERAQDRAISTTAIGFNNGQGPFKRCPGRSRSLPLLAVAAFAAQLCLPVAPAQAQVQVQGEAMRVAEAVVVEQKLEEQSAVVNINSATALELAEGLTGIGGSKAEAIVRYREEFGPFESIDELSEVTGIGAATVERNRQRLRLQ
ncbi:ComEA family DNA-binding protein [Congregibacter litoralis]|uniref:Competence protein ComEA helix-hairpin-helix repeat protein region n=1 Tax=Congregibacter litoralis KT71 TaxID=314285 RepID=A4AAS4_9GAMM|nr:competence protein ComEA helix-hairpin-helix repeat protein region [Congregibacter litoralis KT71]